MLRRSGPEALQDLAPPFNFAWVDAAAGTVEAATDLFGLGQLFFYEGEGVCAVSNSATLLGSLFSRPLDKQALIGFALFGAFQEQDSPFSDVRKVPAAHSIRLAGGVAQLSVIGTTPIRPEAVPPSISALARSTRDLMTSLSDANPDAELELSGGLDSRLILAALPADRRRRHVAMTIGSPDSSDVRIAGQIAAAVGLQHKVEDIEASSGLSGSGLQDILDHASAAYDHSANPIDKAVLVAVNKSRSSPARIGGQNGEILRGFFYTGQNVSAEPSEKMARRLVSWRLQANEFVNPLIFRRDEYAGHRAVAQGRAVQRLLSFGGPWGTALDLFYLYERMQRWAGNSAGNFLTDRAFLCPFFDPDFVRGSLALPAHAKAHSRAAYALLTELDPQLAAMPLASGTVPANAPAGLPGQRIRGASSLIGKFARRLARRLGAGHHTTLGSEIVRQMWHEQELYRNLPIAELDRAGLFAREPLDRLASGRWLPDRPTLGFILMMAGLVGARGELSQHPTN